MKLNLKDKIQLNPFMSGHLVVKTRKVGTTEWITRVDQDNIIVDLGLNLVRDNVFDAASFYVGWGGVSDNTTAPIASDTSLGGNEDRNALTIKNTDTSKQFYGEWYIAATEWAGASITAVTKAGLYYKVTGNFLFSAASFDAISVGTTIEMVVQWTISIASG